MSQKHIAIVTSYPFPDEPVVCNRLTAYIKVLSASGWKVTLISATSRLISSNEVMASLPQCEMRSVPIGDYDRRNFVIRGFNELNHSWRLLQEAALVKPDILIVTIPSIFLLLFALRRFASVHIVDVRDLVWEYLPRYPWWRGIARLLLKKCSLLAMRRADAIALSNPHELKYIQQRLVSKRQLLVSNGIGREQFSYIRNLMYQLDTEDVLRITYIGNIGIAQNLTVLIQAVAGLSQLQVNIIGYGTDFDRVRMAARQYRASNVHFHGSMPWKDAVAWYSRSDVLYAQLSSAFKTAMPSKLYEYLATGLPVVYGGSGTAVEILKSFSGVTVVEPDSPELLRMEFLRMQRQRPQQKYVDNIERISCQYIREDQVKAVEKIIMECYE